MNDLDQNFYENFSQADLDILAEWVNTSISSDEKEKLDGSIKSNIDYSVYQGRPLDYYREVLGFWPTPDQIRITEAAEEHKYLLVESGNAIGKTAIIGAYANYRFDCYYPGIVITSAPTEKSVVQVLWKEIRIRRKGRDMKPAAPEIWKAPNHFAYGTVASSGAAFRGRHEKYMTILFDESTSIPPVYWHNAKTMIQDDDHKFIAIYNPDDPSSQPYLEQLPANSPWHVIQISCLNHPNIAAELAGKPKVIQNAVGLDYVRDQLATAATRLSEHETPEIGYDIEFPPESGEWYRPKLEFEAYVLGRWPTTAVDSIWSRGLIDYCEKTRHPNPVDGNWSEAEITQFVHKWGYPEIGYDPAQMGSDYHSVKVRWGRSIVDSVRLQSVEANTMFPILIDLAKKYGKISGCDPKLIPIKVESDGNYGDGVATLNRALGRENRYRFIQIKAGSRALQPKKYHNRRAELWFSTADMAKDQELEWSRLSTDDKNRLRRQLMAQKKDYPINSRIVIASKKQMKSEIGESPDDGDSLNLACTRYSYYKEEKKVSKDIFNKHKVGQSAQKGSAWLPTTLTRS